MLHRYPAQSLALSKRWFGLLSMLFACASLAGCGKDYQLSQGALWVGSADTAHTDYLARNDDVNFNVSRACLERCSKSSLFAELRAAWPRAKTIDITFASPGWGGAQSYLVTIDGCRYHAKYTCLSNPSQASTFAAEVRNARRADAWGLGAKVAHADALQGLLMTEFVTPVAADDSRAGIWNRVEKFAVALGTLHHVPVEDTEGLSPTHLQDSVFDYWEHAALPQAPHLCQPSPEFLQATKQGLLRIFNWLAQLGITPVYLHGDAHLGNVVDAGDRQVMIDWSDMHIGDPVEDYTQLTFYHGGGHASALTLLYENNVGGPCLERRARLYALVHNLRKHFEWTIYDHSEEDCDGWKADETSLMRSIQQEFSDEKATSAMLECLLSEQ